MGFGVHPPLPQLGGGGVPVVCACTIHPFPGTNSANKVEWDWGLRCTPPPPAHSTPREPGPRALPHQYTPALWVGVQGVGLSALVGMGPQTIPDPSRPFWTRVEHCAPIPINGSRALPRQRTPALGVGVQGVHTMSHNFGAKTRRLITPGRRMVAV